MKPIELLIKQLSDGAYHSGESLGEALGVSRAAVWKQLGKLEEFGLSVQSVKGKGYRLEGGIELLDVQKVRSLLGGNDTQGVELHCFQTLDSTNAEVLRRFSRGETQRVVVLSEMQTAGRGRRGRQWVSPFGCNIYMTVGWKFSGGVAAMRGLTLALGVEAANALQELGVSGIKLKWPNDLLFEGRKLGGILVEVEGDLAGECYCAVGLGLNVGMVQRKGIEDIDQPWEDLTNISTHPVTRNALAAKIIDRWLTLLQDYEKTGFSGYRELWQGIDEYYGKDVLVILGDRKLEGVSRGIDDDGNLLLEVNGRIEIIAGGEVSLRSCV